VTLPYDKSAAIVVLPSLAGEQISNPALRRWLARATVSRIDAPKELLQSVLQCLNLPYPEQGIGALRMWGQTGDRPTVWIAAADPVYLEPRRDKLFLHSLYGDKMPSADLHAIFDYLQERLAASDRYGFAHIGPHGYVRADKPMPTASAPACAVDQQYPNDYMPTGDESGAYHTLRSEVEMALHEHPINVRRESEGLPPVNSLWLWGGGFAPLQNTEPHPPLFADDYLLMGYWQSKTGVAERWPGSIAACLDAAVAGFVAVPNAVADDPDWLQTCLEELRQAMNSGRISQLTLILADGYIVNVQRADSWKFWRQRSALFEPRN
jgi:hypothetical protein